MTKKDYITIALALHAAKPDMQEANPSTTSNGRKLQWEHVINNMCPRLLADNSKFDSTKFREYANNGERYKLK